MVIAELVDVNVRFVVVVAVQVAQVSVVLVRVKVRVPEPEMLAVPEIVRVLAPVTRVPACAPVVSPVKLGL